MWMVRPSLSSRNVCVVLPWAMEARRSETYFSRSPSDDSRLGEIPQEIAHRAAELHQAGRHPEYFNVAGVVDDEPAPGVEHAKAMRHVVERHVEPEFLPVEAGPDLPRAQEDHAAEYADDEDGDARHIDGAFGPVGQRDVHIHADVHGERMMHEAVTGDQAVLPAEHAFHPDDAPACRGQHGLEQRIGAERRGAAHVDRREAREQPAVEPNQRDGRALSGRHGREQLLEIAQLHDADDQPGELAVRTHQPMRDVKDPLPGLAAFHRRADVRGQRRIGLEGLEVLFTRQVLARVRPVARPVDQLAARIGEHERVDRPQIGDPFIEQRVDVVARHLPVELVAGGDPERLHLLHETELGQCQRFQRALDVLGEYRDHVLHLTFAVGENVAAQLRYGEATGRRDRHDEQESEIDDQADGTGVPCRPQAE